MGFGYILWKRTQALKTLAIIFALGLVSFAAYETLPNFQSLVDLTFSPSDDSSLQSVDDGARVSTWATRGPQLSMHLFSARGSTIGEEFRDYGTVVRITFLFRCSWKLASLAEFSSY